VRVLCSICRDSKVVGANHEAALKRFIAQGSLKQFEFIQRAGISQKVNGATSIAVTVESPHAASTRWPAASQRGHQKWHDAPVSNKRLALKEMNSPFTVESVSVQLWHSSRDGIMV
jgi:hypothetical protein